jgi:hypothetical protein
MLNHNFRNPDAHVTAQALSNCGELSGAVALFSFSSNQLATSRCFPYYSHLAQLAQVRAHSHYE